MSEILRRQMLFFRLFGSLVLKIEAMDLRATFGEAWRPEFTAEEYERRGIGSKDSLHCSRLAVDINLFRWNPSAQAWQYLTDTEDYREVGEWWEQQHELAAWGGRFDDGNHFSVEYGGHK